MLSHGRRGWGKQRWWDGWTGKPWSVLLDFVFRVERELDRYISGRFYLASYILLPWFVGLLCSHVSYRSRRSFHSARHLSERHFYICGRWRRSPPVFSHWCRLSFASPCLSTASGACLYASGGCSSASGMLLGVTGMHSNKYDEGAGGWEGCHETRVIATLCVDIGAGTQHAGEFGIVPLNLLRAASESDKSYTRPSGQC